MAALNTTGSTLNANTYEQAIEELSTLVAIAQADTTKNPQQIYGVSFTSDSSTGETRYEYQLPLNLQSAGGARSFIAQNYLEGITYTSGTGALNGGNMLQDLVNLLFDLQKLEKTPASNPTQADRLSLNIDGEDWVFTATLRLPTNLSFSGGRTYRAVPYLV